MTNDDNAKRKLSSSLSAIPGVGKNVTGYEFGVRHNF